MKNKFQFIDKALYFSEQQVLVIGDLHIGYEESLNKQGIFVPRVQFKQIMEDLEKIFDGVGKVKKVIIVGDLKHEFGGISSQEWREVKEVLDYLKGKCDKVILIKGNHDTILGPIAERKEVEVKEYFTYKGICFLHGDKLFSECLGKEVKIIVMGHRHPAILLSDEYKKEKYKCFLVGTWKAKKIIILPSFFPFIEGSEIREIEDNRLFISEKELKDFEVYVVGEKVYKFGKLGKI